MQAKNNPFLADVKSENEKEIDDNESKKSKKET